MDINTKRRELFSSFNIGVEEGNNLIIRPPYFSDEMFFHKECAQCDGKCAAACEEEIIKIGEDKTPYLYFDRSGCSYCDVCADVCEFEVLSVENKHQINVKVDISIRSCISWSESICFSCKDPCLENAIVFQGMFKPVIDPSRCTSCGFCISRCPTSAIEFLS